MHKDTERYLNETALPAWLRYVEETQRFFIENAIRRCESPIEERMLVALAFIRMPFFFGGLRWDDRPALATIDYPGDDFFDHQPAEAAVLWSQVAIGAYRVDFLLTAKLYGNRLAKVVIECDGHDFHERTKEQAARDRRRDRQLTAAGYRVFRFTGSEIFRDAAKCAAEIEAYLFAEEGRTRGED